MEELHLEEMNMKERLVKAVHFHQAVAMKTTAVPFNHFNDDFKVPAIQVDRGCQFSIIVFSCLRI